MTNPPPPDLNLEISPGENQQDATMNPPLTAEEASQDVDTPSPIKIGNFIIPLAVVAWAGVIGIVFYSLKRK